MFFHKCFFFPQSKELSKENVSRKTKKEKNFCTPQQNKWCLSHPRETKRESLPVNSDTIVSFIVNIDKRLITFANMNSWARPLSIYGKHAFCSTQPCIIRLLQLQPQKTMILMKKTNAHTHTNTHLNCKSSPSPYEHFLWGRNVLQVIM